MLTDASLADAMMTAAGFSDVTLQDVASELWVAAPEDLFDAFDQGAVRAASLLGGQTAERRAAIREDIARRVLSEGKEEKGGYIVPAPSVLISAQR